MKPNRVPPCVRLIGVLLLANPAVFSQIKVAEYTETTETLVESIVFEIHRTGTTISLHMRTTDEEHLMEFDTRWNTRKWQVLDDSGQRLSTVEKRDGRIYLDAKEIIAEDLDLPWYQSLICLSPRIAKGESRFKFYIASANFGEELMGEAGIQFTEFVAKREDEEPVIVDGKKVNAVKYRVTFDDIRALFWRSYAWYRESDGFLIMYESIRGGPGTPATVGELVSERSER